MNHQINDLSGLSPSVSSSPSAPSLPLSETIASIASKLECSFCFDRYKDARVLPCGHTFCLRCLQKQVDNSTSGSSSSNSRQQSCGLCRARWSVPVDGLDGLPKNFAVEAAINSNFQVAQSLAECVMVAGKEKHATAQYYCVDCQGHLCLSCFEIHKKTEITAQHNVKSISDIIANQLTNKDAGRKAALQCKIHKYQEVTLFCIHCDEVCCIACCLTSHQQHACVALKEANENFVEQISKFIRSSRNTTNRLAAAQQKNHKLLEGIREDHRSVANDFEHFVSKTKQKVQDICDKVMKELDASKLAAVNAVVKEAEAEKKRLEMENGRMSESMKKLQQTIAIHETFLLPTSSAIDRARVAKSLQKNDETKKDEEFNSVVSYTSSLSSWKAEIAKWLETFSETVTRLPNVPQLSIGNNGAAKQLITHTVSTPLVQSRPVIDASLYRAILVPQMKVCNRAVDIISFHDDNILISDYLSNELFVYSNEGSYVKTLTVPGKMRDAVWLPGGNIICTTCNNRIVMTITQSSDVINETQMTNPNRLTMSSNGCTYLADSESGVYETLDGGSTWKLLFKMPDYRWHCWQVIKVSSQDDGDAFWALESNNGTCRLREYRLSSSTDKRSSASQLTWRDINTSTSPGVDIDLHYGRLAYDEQTNVFLSDFSNSTVHVFSTSGEHQRQLLSVMHGLDGPRAIIYDSRRKILCVGQRKGEVKQFSLTDGTTRRQSTFRHSISATDLTPTCQTRRQSEIPADFRPSSLFRRNSEMPKFFLAASLRRRATSISDSFEASDKGD